MQEIDLDMTDPADESGVIRRVESVLAEAGLTMHTRGTLKRYPGCTHWHWRNGTLPGTLEVTFWPARRRLWFKVQSGRRAPWIDLMTPGLVAKLQQR